jgi:hypothetical protein
MTCKEITEQLEGIAPAEDFANSSGELTEAWSAAGVGVESVEPILHFMEEHPDLDYGMPGPLVHFTENFYLKGYEEKLVESVARKPTMMTVWMLNRILNGAKEPSRRQALVRAMRQAADNRSADRDTLERIQGFLERLES